MPNAVGAYLHTSKVRIKLDKKVRQGSIENDENHWYEWTAIR